MPTYICKCGEEFEGSEFQLSKDCLDCERTATPAPPPNVWGGPIRRMTMEEWARTTPGPEIGRIDTVRFVTDNPTYAQQAQVATQLLQAQAANLHEALRAQARQLGNYPYYDFGTTLGGNIGGQNRNTTDQEHEELTF